jgi:hypothetical protein
VREREREREREKEKREKGALFMEPSNKLLERETKFFFSLLLQHQKT